MIIERERENLMIYFKLINNNLISFKYINVFISPLLGFKNQIKNCRKTNINKLAKPHNIINQYQQKEQEQEKNDLLTTFNFNMASTPKSMRKMKKRTVIAASTIANTTTSDFDGVEFLNTKCTSSCYQLSSTIKTTSSSTCCACCCCCCCCASNNQQKQNSLATHNTKQIYLARSNSGYKLVQVIDGNNKISKRVSAARNNTNKFNYYDVKNKYSKYYASRKSHKLPLALRPIDIQEFERQNSEPLVKKVPQVSSSTTTTSTSYDVSCNQVVNCNGYLKKLIEKTKKKAQSMKKKSCTSSSSEERNNDLIKKHKISLFSRKVKKSLIEQSEFKIESNTNRIIEVDGETNDFVEDRSFVQDTFLTDFNQFGQFRVWYV